MTVEELIELLVMYPPEFDVRIAVGRRPPGVYAINTGVRDVVRADEVLEDEHVVYLLGEQ